MPSKSYANSRLATFVEKRILELRGKKSQAEIAHDAGFVNPNVLTMIKQGSTKLPLDRVPALAKALDTDPRRLFLLAFEQSGGETLMHALEEIFGTVVTRNEVAWLKAIRDASDHSDPNLTSRSHAAIKGIFGK